MQKRFDSEYQGDVYTLVTSQDRIETTSGHPFWVTSGVDLESRPSAYQLESAENEGESISGRWLNASELEIGDTLFSKAGLHVTLLEIHSRHEDGFPVSNLSILYNPNFAVGSDQVLVHNTKALKPDSCSVSGGGVVEASASVAPNSGLRNRGRYLGQKQGREFRTDQLQIHEFDASQPKHVRGWLENERRRIASGNGSNLPRNPSGYVLGHGRATPAREGFDYSNSRLQLSELNSLEESVRRRLGMP